MPHAAADAFAAGSAALSARPRPAHPGIWAVEVYVPSGVVRQEALESHDGAPAGKYTAGLGQAGMAVAGEQEDVVSMSLTGERKGEGAGATGREGAIDPPGLRRKYRVLEAAGGHPDRTQGGAGFRRWGGGGGRGARLALRGRRPAAASMHTLWAGWGRVGGVEAREGNGDGHAHVLCGGTFSFGAPESHTL